jgi:hypothetical protein
MDSLLMVDSCDYPIKKTALLSPWYPIYFLVKSHGKNPPQKIPGLSVPHYKGFSHLLASFIMGKANSS